MDVLAELPGRRVIGIAIKTSSAPGKDDIRHLQWLRDELGDRFTMGLLLHTGPRVFRFDDQILAVPIASLWRRKARAGDQDVRKGR